LSLGEPYNNSTLNATMIRGAALLAKVKELGPVSKSELVRQCGFVSTRKDGSQRLHFADFYEALLEAKGVSFQEPAGKALSKEGRQLTFNTHVHFNGNLMVGKAYTELLDLQPGDRFEIRMERHGFRLVPMTGTP
jgi:hypothetical protein